MDFLYTIKFRSVKFERVLVKNQNNCYKQGCGRFPIKSLSVVTFDITVCIARWPNSTFEV